MSKIKTILLATLTLLCSTAISIQAEELAVKRIPHTGQAAEFYFAPDGKQVIKFIRSM